MEGETVPVRPSMKFNFFERRPSGCGQQFSGHSPGFITYPGGYPDMFETLFGMRHAAHNRLKWKKEKNIIFF